MATVVANRVDEVSPDAHSPAGRSAASWGAIIAGAFVAVSASLILLTLGAGLGFAAVSPWQGQGISAITFTVTTAIWLIVTQWVSAALGGYIAGRLRTRWIGTHGHEVFFRDTAHGLVTWALATVVVAMLVAGSVSSLISGTSHATTSVVATGAASISSAASSPGTGYNVDKLFRSTNVAADGGADYRVEAAHVAVNAGLTGDVPAADRTYLAGVVAQKTAVSQEDAQKRVDEFVSDIQQAEAKTKAAADTARKAASQASIYTALSMLLGAFIASVSAAIGGHLRDDQV